MKHAAVLPAALSGRASDAAEVRGESGSYRVGTGADEGERNTGQPRGICLHFCAKEESCKSDRRPLSAAKTEFGSMNVQGVKRMYNVFLFLRSKEDSTSS